MPVATSVSSGRKPIQIRADALRHMDVPFAMRGFPMMPDVAAISETGPARSEQGWCEADLKRAIAAAEEAGLRAYRVEISPDGTITIIVGDPAAEPGSE